jgi:hypothetical protein
MRTLVDIRNEKALISQINWDMEPRERIRRKGNETREEVEEIERQMQARVGFYFFIEVRNLQIALYLYENYPDGSGDFIAEIIEMPEQMIHEAITEAGGNIKTDGRYPINDSIRSWLKNRLAD